MVKTYDISGIDRIAMEAWDFGKAFKVWAFSAPMGAGKTTFIHSLCEFLGVDDAVGSPTYALINEYDSPVAGTIYHMDWYRLKDEEEALQAGMEDALLSGNVCFIEWPEKAGSLLPMDYLLISIEIIDEQRRRISFSPKNHVIKKT